MSHVIGSTIGPPIRCLATCLQFHQAKMLASRPFVQLSALCFSLYAHQGRPAAAAGGGSSVKDFFRAAKPPTGRKTTKKAANGKAAAAAAAAAVEPEAKPEQQQEEVDDGPMLSTQDMRLSR